MGVTCDRYFTDKYSLEAKERYRESADAGKVRSVEPETAHEDMDFARHAAR